MKNSEPSETNQTHSISGTGVLRSIFGGILMGLANLVPGISGGTMLLAAGIYPQFIDAIAELTRLRFRMASLSVLGVVVVSAGLAILLGAGALKELVVNHRWIMYSLFIGLTLGGIPAVWRLARPASASLVFSALAAFGLMVTLAVLQHFNVVGSNSSNFMMLLFAGLAGASAMILPGLSGGYILLLMGQYVPILSAVDQVKEAISAKDVSAAMEPVGSVVLPVGLGMVAGVVVVGNLIQWLLNRYRKATLGFLLGLLIGSVAGLWPFRIGVEPAVGDELKGRTVTSENIGEFDPEDWHTESFLPSGIQIASSIGLILLGVGITWGVSKIGGDESE